MTTRSHTAFVTGSGRRLGRQIAYALAEAGYDIILHYHESAAGADEARAHIESLGRRVWSVRADLSDLRQVREACGRIGEFVSQLDLLVNSAGVFPEAAFGEMTEDVWDQALNVNTRAVFFVTQGCAPLLRSCGGSVVNIVSAGAFEPWKRHISYNVSKAGAVMLTRSMAKALAPEVRVNAVAPGVILVPGEEQREHIPAERFPLRRYGNARDIAAAVLYLGRDALYTTGHVLPVDGGTGEAS